MKDQALTNFKNFNINASVLSVWVFKKRPNNTFSAKSIEVTDSLATEIKNIATNSVQACTEIEDYALLAQINEAGSLHVGTDETFFHNLQAVVDLPAEEHRYSTARDLKGVAGYLFRMRHNDQILYGVRHVTDAWQTRKAKTVLNVVLRANQLDVSNEPNFTIARTLDFCVLGNDVLIFYKRYFESLLDYKIQYASSFTEMQAEAEFMSSFTNLAPLIEHVGTNAMQLRRMAVIHSKGHYKDPAYMSRLKQLSAAKGWNIQFDQAGKIIPTPESLKDIIQVLLNHRLHSELSLNDFDVPMTTPI